MPAGAGDLTATLLKPADPGAEGFYRIDPERASARVELVDGDAPVPVLSIAAPPTVARGGATAFLLSAQPAPAQPIAATVAAATVAASGGRRIVPIDQRGVALLAVRADGDSRFERNGALVGCLRGDPDGPYGLLAQTEEAACARIWILEPGASEFGITTVSLTAPPTIGGGGRALLLLSADPPPGPSGVHVRVKVASVDGNRDVLLPGEAGPRTGFVGADGIGFLRVRTRNAAGRFSASIPAADEPVPPRRDGPFGGSGRSGRGQRGRSGAGRCGRPRPNGR